MYERSNSDLARMAGNRPGFGLGTNGGTTNIDERRAAIALLPPFVHRLKPVSQPGVEPCWEAPTYEDSGIELGPGESVPPEEERAPGPLVDMPPERPGWVLPVVVLGGLGLVGGGIWFFFLRDKGEPKEVSSNPFSLERLRDKAAGPPGPGYVWRRPHKARVRGQRRRKLIRGQWVRRGTPRGMPPWGAWEGLERNR
jgi:hypothetical protein